MNQELMTLDFWQDTVVYGGKTLPGGDLHDLWACRLMERTPHL